MAGGKCRNLDFAKTVLLYLWLEENAAIWEYQPGFRNDCSTVDQIFNRYAFVQKCLKMKAQNVIVAFADFRKTFDSVRHDKLSDCIRIQGVGEVVWCYWGYV